MRDKWHDLRKNPADLPKKDGQYLTVRFYDHMPFYCVLIFKKIDEEDGKTIKDSFWDYDSEWGYYQSNGFRAWADIPEFEEGYKWD